MKKWASHAMSSALMFLPLASCHAGVSATSDHIIGSSLASKGTAPSVNSDNEPSTTREASTMSSDSSSIYPTITAEQTLLRVLDLIRTSKAIAELTPGRLEHVMKVPITTWEKGYGFGEQLTSQWGVGFNVTLWEGQPRFALTFSPSPPPPPGQATPPMADICQLDFDHFTAELTAMGFTRGSHYDTLPPWNGPGERPPGEKGRLMYDYFDRPGMRVEVYPQGESNEKAGHSCVEWVFVY